MQAMGETNREAAVIRPDADLWIAHNCVYCKNKKTCDLYKGLIEAQKKLDFKANTLDCPWLRTHS